MTEMEVRLAAMLQMGTKDPINPNIKTIADVKGTDCETHFEYAYKDAKGLLAALDIQSELYESRFANKKRKFIFRGHMNANWPLIPSLFRIFSRTEFADDANGEKQFEKATEQQKQQILAHWHGASIDIEITLFANFLHEINELGYMIEDESIELLEENRNKKDFIDTAPLSFSNVDRAYPTKKQMRTLALAQHYGIYTRLLDWSTNPYKALFFATEQINCNRKPDDMNIGIWVIPRFLLEATKIQKYLEIVEVPKFQNKNIIAQQGIFTNYVSSLDNQFSKLHDFPINSTEDGIMPFDEYISNPNGNQLMKQIIEKVTGKPMLFTLPHSEVDEVQEKLHHLGLTWTTMMPNLEGAVKAAHKNR